MPEVANVPLYNLSLVDVCNNALNLIGQQEIRALDDTDQSTQATLCKRQLPDILAAMLRNHDWSFNRRRVYLPEIDPDIVRQILTGGFGGGGFGGGGFGGGDGMAVVIAEPSGPFSHWYALPNNFLRAWQINNSDEFKFAIEYGALLSNETQVLLKYSAYVNDPNLWDAMFRIGIETYLAARLVSPLGGDLKRAELFMLEALGDRRTGAPGIFQDAAAVVGQEGTVEAFEVVNLTTLIREM